MPDAAAPSSSAESTKLTGKKKRLERQRRRLSIAFGQARSAPRRRSSSWPTNKRARSATRSLHRLARYAGEQPTKPRPQADLDAPSGDRPPAVVCHHNATRPSQRQRGDQHVDGRRGFVVAALDCVEGRDGQTEQAADGELAEHQQKGARKDVHVDRGERGAGNGRGAPLTPPPPAAESAARSARAQQPPLAPALQQADADQQQADDGDQAAAARARRCRNRASRRRHRSRRGRRCRRSSSVALVRGVSRVKPSKEPLGSTSSGARDAPFVLAAPCCG